MTIDTPAGTINQITPIREFVELTTITNAQYLLGIQNMSTGNGAKITFGNLITSLISGNADNKLVKGSDDKLFISTPVEIGTLANLTTTNKTNLVSAINELNSNMGSLSNLETTVKTSLVAAINSVAELTEPELLIDKVNQSKALVTGNVAGYQEELEQLKLMKRSTFDRSKFEKLGTPVLTQDGIAGNFGQHDGGNNIVYTDLGQQIDYNTFELHLGEYIIEKTNTNQWLFLCGNKHASGDISYAYGLRLMINAANRIRYFMSSNETSADVSGERWGNIVYSQGQRVRLKLVFDGSAYTFYSSINNAEWQVDSTFDSSLKITLGRYLTFGNDSGVTPFLGTINLKEVYLIVNGIEIFNANKENIDILKERDFNTYIQLFAYKYNNLFIYADLPTPSTSTLNLKPTTLYNADGTLYEGEDWAITEQGGITYQGNSATYSLNDNIFETISNNNWDKPCSCKIQNGIASDFTHGCSIQKRLTFVPKKSVLYRAKFKTPSTVTPDRNMAVWRFYNNASGSFITNAIIIRTDGICRIQYKDGTYASFSYQPDTVYIVESYFTYNGWYGKVYDESGNLLHSFQDLNHPETSIMQGANSQFTIGASCNVGSYINLAPLRQGAWVDLCSIQVFVDDELLYQPMLEIPYYETSIQYGSKIVDTLYRNRVLDAYQQSFKDYKYYTLDEANGNFTLPHGEIYGMLEQIRTENEQNNEAVRQIVDVKDNLYKILEGHQSTNKALWDLITFTDNSEADNLLVGGDSPYTSNSSSSNFHFYLLNSTTGSSYNPDDTAKANVYKLFNKSHFDSQSDPIYVKDGTIVITCANPTKLSKILLRSYDTNTALPTIITVCGANITNNMSREIVSSDFSSAKYIGGISQTKEAAYNDPTSTNWGLNRPLELTIDDKDTFNTFFINMSYWYLANGTDRRLVGIKLYGTQMTNDDSDYTVKMSGEYENCKWIASNGNIYNTDNLYQQYGYIPKEKASLARWVSCFGSGIGQANATTRAPEQYYPRYISGSISSTTLTSGQPWWVLRQTNYSAENRPQTGYNTSGAGYIQKNTTLNNQTVIDYTADSYFPVGEYYWEGIFGYNDASRGNCYLANWCQLQKVYDDDSVEIIQTFSKEGSMYEPSVCYRTPRFYTSRAFKKLRLIVQEENYPNNSFVLSQMQLYYRDTTGTIARSFIPSATQYDLSYNTVKHKSNIHFFITPTGVRVGSNCFIQKTDPTVRAACVGNRWINENTKKSYVCNTSGVWTEEDFCEIGCMTMFGSKHVGMRLRTVANSENPMQKYIQDYEDIGGNLALNYNMVSNATTVITTSPTDPDYYFQAEAADENAGVNFYMPANTINIQAYRRALVKSKIYQSGQQFAHWSNSSRMGAVLMAYKTFDTSAAGEYIEGSEEEEQ